MAKLKESSWENKEGVTQYKYDIKTMDKFGAGLVVDQDVFKGVFNFAPVIKVISYFDKKKKENSSFTVIEATVKCLNPEDFTNLKVDETYGTIRVNLPASKDVLEALEQEESVQKTLFGKEVTEVTGVHYHSFEITPKSFMATDKDGKEEQRTFFKFTIGERVQETETESKNETSEEAPVQVTGDVFPEEKINAVKKALAAGKVTKDSMVKINGVSVKVSEVLGEASDEEVNF